MISPNELRIGNWVKVGTNESIVDYLHAGSIGLQGNLITNNFNQVDPISLTPEILEKCGFSDRGFTNVWFFKNYWLPNKWTICYCIKTTEIHTAGLYYAAHANDIEVKYLHQLQNLYFALTGTELNYSQDNKINP